MRLRFKLPVNSRAQIQLFKIASPGEKLEAVFGTKTLHIEHTIHFNASWRMKPFHQKVTSSRP